jgi:hypothetical protein
VFFGLLGAISVGICDLELVLNISALIFGIGSTGSLGLPFGIWFGHLGLIICVLVYRVLGPELELVRNGVVSRHGIHWVLVSAIWNCLTIWVYF